MDAEQARNNNRTYADDIKDIAFATFTRELDFVVRRASTTGNTGAVVTVEEPAKEKAESYILTKGYTITDKGESTHTTDTWFRITW
jgi:hypothetical protein